jgi:hypothetical protein
MSAWLRKTSGVPGSAPGGLVWTTAEDVAEAEGAPAPAKTARKSAAKAPAKTEIQE